MDVNCTSVPNVHMEAIRGPSPPRSYRSAYDVCGGWRCTQSRPASDLKVLAKRDATQTASDTQQSYPFFSSDTEKRTAPSLSCQRHPTAHIAGRPPKKKVPWFTRIQQMSLSPEFTDLRFPFPKYPRQRPSLALFFDAHSAINVHESSPICPRSGFLPLAVCCKICKNQPDEIALIAHSLSKWPRALHCNTHYDAPPQRSYRSGRHQP